MGADGVNFFRRGHDRKDVETALEDARGLVEILKLSRANLSVPDAILQEAAARLAEDDASAASELVARAERIANSLETDYRAATEVVEKLRAHVGRAKAAGARADEETKALEEVHAKAISARDLEGYMVPDYASARAIAEAAWARLQGQKAGSESAGSAIAAAEAVIEGALKGTLQGPPKGAEDPLQEARQLVTKARAEREAGHFEVAMSDAAMAEKVAVTVEEQRQRARETLESVERLLTGLHAVGVPVTAIARSLDLGRTLLARGRIVAAVDIFNEAAQEAVQLGTAYRQLLDAMSAAAKAIEGVRGEGLPVGDAEAAFGRAKNAMKAGNYALAQACCDDVHLAIRKQQETRDGLRSWLDETKAHVEDLRSLGLALVNDVDEMVVRAEQEFANGDYAATNEDLRIAALLMRPALNGKVRDGVEVTR